MANHNGNHDSRERLLDVAQQLFHQRGYRAVTMQEIARSLGIRQASLYYHVPDGKEQLFVAVAQRTFERHRQGLQSTIDKAAPQLEAQLQAIARWFAAQPPMNLLGMMHADMPALSKANHRALEAAAYRCLFEPVAATFQAAVERGEIRDIQADLLAGSFLALMDGISYSSQHQPGTPPRQVMADTIISIVLDGLRPRNQAPEEAQP
jgi:AcrR family transcriptional regulator